MKHVDMKTCVINIVVNGPNYDIISQLSCSPSSFPPPNVSLSLAHCFISLKCQDPLKANLILASYQLFAHTQWNFCIKVGNKYMSQNGANDAGNLWQENPLPTLGRYKTKSWSA